ncbi:hypothetical protein ANOM_009683, partial [Aspergillus nomiae NRRL 13137]
LHVAGSPFLTFTLFSTRCSLPVRKRSRRSRLELVSRRLSRLSALPLPVVSFCISLPSLSISSRSSFKRPIIRTVYVMTGIH